MSAHYQFGPYQLNRPNFSLQCPAFSLQAINHITGKNGVGKSTLVELLRADCEQKGIKYSWVDQNYRSAWYWWLSPRQNIEKAWASGGKAGLVWDIPSVKHELSWLSDLLDRTVEGDVSKGTIFSHIGLSGGQLQKLVLLREVISQPEVLFLDEAFSALDDQGLQEITQWLLTLQKDISFSVVSIAHNQAVIKYLPGVVITMEQQDSQVAQTTVKLPQTL
jgi:ABC-type Mn2+/Zn2+ transport system ATPase subunit